YVRTRIRLKLKERIPLWIPQTFVTRSTSKSTRAITNRLWRYRMALQLSQKQIAERLGHKSTAQVSCWENCQKTPTLDNALMRGHILKAPVEALFAELTAELLSEIDTRVSGMAGAGE